MSPLFSKLFDHLGWADREVATALASGPEPAPEWLELLGHILGSEHTWLARIEQRTPTVAVWPRLGVEECLALGRTNLEGYRALLSRLAPGDFQRLIHYRNSAGLEFDSTIEDILLHVCLHGSYHRGQIARAVRRGGGTPAPTDYIGFTRGAPAATRQR